MPQIIYENRDMLVVNKPAGLLVHSAHSSKTALVEPTLVDWLLKNYPEIKNVGDPSISPGQATLRPGIVHRLDKDTSGVMIIAKNQTAFEYLKNLFQNHKIKKNYLALVVGKLNPPTGGEKGIIDLPIGRSKSPLQRLAGKKARGKLREAITEYKVLEEFWSSQDQRFYTFIEVYPKTGRTHQVRVHLKAIGHPVACDKLYSKSPACPFGLSRQFLHARSLELALPDGSINLFEADLPNDLEKTLKELRKKNNYGNNK